VRGHAAALAERRATLHSACTPPTKEFIMLTAIFSAIPLWIFPLLFGLIMLGLRASRDRSVTPVLVYAMPLLGLLSLNRALSLGASEAAIAALLLAYGAGAVWGYRAQAAWTVGRDARRVQLRGEWVTMGTILGLFVLNFATGMVQGMAPALADGTGFAFSFGVIAGALSGSLAGRAVRVAMWPVRD
jgi:hypothetical protein